MLLGAALQCASSIKSTPKRLDRSLTSAPGCFVVDCEIARKSIGCSLTIHRVEISVVSGKSFMAHRAASDILIASTRLQFRNQNRKYEDGITREVKDLAIP